MDLVAGRGRVNLWLRLRKNQVALQKRTGHQEKSMQYEIYAHCHLMLMYFVPHAKDNWFEYAGKQSIELCRLFRVHLNGTNIVS